MTGLGKDLGDFSCAMHTVLAVRQAHFLKVRGTASAEAPSAASFEAVERLDSHVVTVQLTHALMRDRAAYPGREATFLIDPSNGSEARRFAGCITRFSRTPHPRISAAMKSSSSRCSHGGE